jgi:hypothetical protein
VISVLMKSDFLSGLKTGACTMHFSVNIHIDRIEKDVDVGKLLFRIKDELDDHATRTIGYLRG